jgi:beta-glucosidase
MLLQEHLRDDWDFHGYVVSDCGAASDILRNHHYAETMPQGMADAVKSGMDIICTWPVPEVKLESAALLAAVQQGLLPEADVDRSVRSLFTARMKLGMFEGSPRNARIAQEQRQSPSSGFQVQEHRRHRTEC